MSRRRTRALMVRPAGALGAKDFETFAAAVEAEGRLRGLLIHATRFSVWNGFAGLRARLRFVAVVTGHMLVQLGPSLGNRASTPPIPLISTARPRYRSRLAARGRRMCRHQTLMLDRERTERCHLCQLAADTGDPGRPP